MRPTMRDSQGGIPMKHSIQKWTVLARVLTLMTCTLAPTGTLAAAEVSFEQYEVVTGVAIRQTVLTGFLFDGAMADLAVLNIDENGDRRLRIYAFGDGTWAPRLDATLRPEVLFVDVANTVHFWIECFIGTSGRKSIMTSVSPLWSRVVSAIWCSVRETSISGRFLIRRRIEPGSR